MPNNLSIDPTRDGFHDRYDAAIALPICSEEPNDNADLYLPDDGLTVSPPAFTIPRSWRTETLLGETERWADRDDLSILAAAAAALPVVGLAELARALDTIDSDLRATVRPLDLRQLTSLLDGLSTRLRQIQDLLPPDQQSRLDPAYRGGPVRDANDLGGRARELGCRIARERADLIRTRSTDRANAYSAELANAYEEAGLFGQAMQVYQRLERNDPAQATDHWRKRRSLSEAYVRLQRIHNEYLYEVEEALRHPASSTMTLSGIRDLFERVGRAYSLLESIPNRPTDPRHSRFYALWLEFCCYRGRYHTMGEPSALGHANKAAQAFIDRLPGRGDQVFLPPSWIGDVTLCRVEDLVAGHHYTEALTLIERIIEQFAAPEQDPAWRKIVMAFDEKIGDLHLHLLNGTEEADRYEHLKAAYRSYRRAAIALVMEGEGAIDPSEHRRLTERLLQIADRAQGLSPLERKADWQYHVDFHQGELARLSGASAPASLTSKEVLPQALERGLAQNPGRSVEEVERDLKEREAAEGEAAQARDSHTRGGEAGRQEYALDLTGKRPRR